MWHSMTDIHLGPHLGEVEHIVRDNSEKIVDVIFGCVVMDIGMPNSI